MPDIELASILSILSISESGNEKIILLYLRELDEIAPTIDLHWYENKGLNSSASFIWEKHKLKQWLVIGSDKNIYDLFHKMTSTGKDLLVVNGISYKIPGKIVSMHDVNLLDDNNNEYFTLENWNDIVGKNINFLFVESNFSFIEGYDDSKNEGEIIVPPAFYPKGVLFKYFDKQIFGIIEKRIFSDLRGDFQEGESPKLRGFIQLSPTVRKEVEISIVDLEGRMTYKPKIDIESGIWELNLDEALWKGKEIIKKN